MISITGASLFPYISFEEQRKQYELLSPQAQMVYEKIKDKIKVDNDTDTVQIYKNVVYNLSETFVGNLEELSKFAFNFPLILYKLYEKGFINIYISVAYYKDNKVFFPLKNVTESDFVYKTNEPVIMFTVNKKKVKDVCRYLNMKILEAMASEIPNVIECEFGALGERFGYFRSNAVPIFVTEEEYKKMYKLYNKYKKGDMAEVLKYYDDFVDSKNANYDLLFMAAVQMLYAYEGDELTEDQERLKQVLLYAVRRQTPITEILPDLNARLVVMFFLINEYLEKNKFAQDQFVLFSSIFSYYDVTKFIEDDIYFNIIPYGTDKLEIPRDIIDYYTYKNPHLATDFETAAGKYASLLERMECYELLQKAKEDIPVLREAIKDYVSVRTMISLMSSKANIFYVKTYNPKRFQEYKTAIEDVYNIVSKDSRVDVNVAKIVDELYQLYMSFIEKYMNLSVTSKDDCDNIYMLYMLFKTAAHLYSS